MGSSTYANEAAFIKELQSQLDRLDEHAPAIPGSVERRLGASIRTNGD